MGRSKCNLANAWQTMGKYAEAAELVRDVLCVQTNVLPGSWTHAA